MVNKTNITGSEEFTYTYTFENDEQYIDSSTLTIETYFPNTIYFELPDINNYIYDMRVIELVDGKKVVFQLQGIRLGTNELFSIKAKFTNGRSNNQTYINEATVFRDGVEFMEDSADEVTLTLNSSFKIRQYVVNDVTPKPGDIVNYRIELFNDGDGGAQLDNVLIEDLLPEYLTPTETLPIGHDESLEFTDTRYQDDTGLWNDNKLTFNLDNYKGTRYVIDYSAILSEYVPDNYEVRNKVLLKSNDNIISFYTDEFTTKNSNVSTLNIEAPNYAYLDDVVQYKIYMENNDTEEFRDVLFKTVLPVGFKAKYLKPVLNLSDVSNFSIYVKTRNNPDDSILITDDISSIVDKINLYEFISDIDEIMTIEFRMDTFINDLSPIECLLEGTINDTVVEGDILTNNCSLVGVCSKYNILLEKSNDITISNISSLYVEHYLDSPKEYYDEGDVLDFTIKAYAKESLIKGPIISCIVPKGLTLDDESMYHTYYNDFENKLYDYRDGNWPIQSPNINIRYDFVEHGETYFRYQFFKAPIGFKDYIEIHFKAIVNDQCFDDFSLKSFLGDPTNDAEIISDKYYDTDNLDMDDYIDEYIATTEPILCKLLDKTPTIVVIDKTIILNKNFDPLKDVIAFDYLGNNITGDIVVEENNVDVTNEGVYEVTYYVCDQYGNNTTKSILVTVASYNEYFEQAINDVIKSIALQQTALHNILFQEGEKINKAMELTSDPDVITEVNDSVTSMIATISKLEYFLQCKINTVLNK